MKQKVRERLRAIHLRERGYSLNEIVTEVGVAKGSVSMWVRNVPLTGKARTRLLTKIKLGQLVAAESKRRKTRAILDHHFQNATREISNQRFAKVYKKIACSLLYWCEGSKDHFRGAHFVNSDPRLVKTFLQLLRESFDIDERKFRVCVHLHKYHDPEKQLKFWSKVTGIPRSQFIKPYLKPNTGKRIRKEYPGCVAIRYHSNDIARQLLTTAEASLTQFGGVG